MASNDSRDGTQSKKILSTSRFFTQKGPPSPAPSQFSESKRPGFVRRTWGKLTGKHAQGGSSDEAPISAATSENVASPDAPIEGSRTSSTQPEQQTIPTEVEAPAAPPPKAESETMDNVKLAGRFLQTVVKNVARILDDNPAKLAFNIVNAVLDAKDKIEENKGTVARRLVSTAKELKVVSDALEGWDPKGVEIQRFQQFERSMMDGLRELKQLADESTLRKILDHEDEQRRIAEIFERINEARILFELGIASKSFRVVTRIYDHLINLRLKELKPSKIADHQYLLEGKEKEDMPRVACTPGTRVRIIKEIVLWANNTSVDSPRVYWLFGLAGLGKTTIAYTMARRFESALDPDDTIILAASFFCSRQMDETRRSGCIVRTLVYQLASKCKPFANALGALDAAERSVRDQFNDLLVKPWKESETDRLKDTALPRAYLVIIDALDEIEGDGGSTFLTDLVNIINEHRLPGLKFLVTSRPDPTLVRHVESLTQKTLFQLHEVDEKVVSEDIRTYLAESLPFFAKNQLIDKLVGLTSGLFIYAATVAKLLVGREPIEQQEFIEDLVSTSTLTYSEDPDTTLPLDRLYLQILSDAFKTFGQKSPARLRRIGFIHTIICALEPISPTMAAHLHVTERPEIDPDLFASKVVRSVLAHLHAVLYMKGDRVFWFHKSFPDFIFDKQRSKEFWCDAENYHPQLAGYCFRIMKEGLRFNIADIKSSFLLDIEDDTLSDRVEKNISSTLSYSCRYWGQHIKSSSPANIEAIIRLLTEFIQKSGLFWIEAMNLLRSRGSCRPMLDGVHEWVSRSKENCSTLKALLAEFASFAHHFSGSPAASSTPHLYISSLATWPRATNPCAQWKTSFPTIPSFKSSSEGGASLMSIAVKSPVNAIAVSRDGKWIVSGSVDETVRVWDSTTGQELKVLRGHDEEVQSVAFSDNSKWIVSGSNDKTVRVWDSTTGEVLKVLRGHDSWVRSAAFSSNSKWIVSGSDDRTVRVWDSTTGEELKVLRGHDKKVQSVAFSSNSKWIVSGSDDNTVRVWDSTTGKELKVLRGHGDCVLSVAFSSDTKWIISGSDDKTVRVWDSTTGKELQVLRGHGDCVQSVAFSSDSKWIVSGSDDNTVRVWDSTTCKGLEVLRGHGDCVQSVAFSSNSKCIVSGSDDRTVRVWDSTTGKELKVLRGHGSWVQSVAFSNNSKWIVSGSDDKTVRVWDSTTGEELKVLRGHDEKVQSVAFSSDSKWIVSGWDDRTVRVWDSMTGEELNVLRGHGDWVQSVAFSSDTKWIVSGSDDKTLRVWDSMTGKELKVLRGHGSWVQSVAFSSDSKWIVSGSNDRTVRVWDSTTGEELKVLRGHGDCVQSVAFSSNSKWIVSGSDDKTVRVWDSTRGVALKVLMGHRHWVQSVAFSNDNKWIVSGSDDMTVRVWDSTTGEDLALGSACKTFLDSSSNIPISYNHYTREMTGQPLQPTGWLFSPQSNHRLMFVPPAANLPDSANILTIPPSAVSRVDFRNASLGPKWTECHTRHAI